jgi:hypothetical protein
MAGAPSVTRHFRIDADAVVADSQYERALPVVQLCLDVSCLGMLSRIAQGFAGDAVHVIPNQWRDRPRLPLYHDAE